jgi:hypothetical protein
LLKFLAKPIKALAKGRGFNFFIGTFACFFATFFIYGKSLWFFTSLLTFAIFYTQIYKARQNYKAKYKEKHALRAKQLLSN